MKIGGKKITLSMLWGAIKLVSSGLAKAYAGDNVVSWRELTMIMLDLAAYLNLPVDTKGLSVPKDLKDKLNIF